MNPVEEFEKLVDLTVDEALSFALASVIDKELDPEIYETLLSKLGDVEKNAFTMGLASEGIKVNAMSGRLEELKNHFMQLAKTQGCVYEDDYHAACYDITDSHLLGEVNVWLISAGLPLKKNKPHCDVEKVKNKQKYKEDVLNKVKNPNINKFSKKIAAADKELNKIIKDAKDPDYKTEFLPSWKKRKKAQESLPMFELTEEQRQLLEFINTNSRYYSQDVSSLLSSAYVTPRDLKAAKIALDGVVELSPELDQVETALQLLVQIDSLLGEKIAKTRKFAQRIDEEKRQLADTIRAREYEIPNARELLRRVERAEDFSEIREIWDMIHDPAFASKAETEVRVPKTMESVSFDSVSFKATVASSAHQKAAGLEVVDKLEKNEGMLFPFENEHVTFHMGSVKFPIDIVFLLEDPNGLKVAKIVHNAQPGAIERWSFGPTTYVLEVPGGSCKEHGIKLHSRCKISKRVSLR